PAGLWTALRARAPRSRPRSPRSPARAPLLRSSPAGSRQRHRSNPTSELVQPDDVQPDESQFAVVVQLDEFHVAAVQLDDVQLDRVQPEESHFAAIVALLTHFTPGGQTSAGTPWFARPGEPEMLYEEERLSELIVEPIGFGPCFAVSAHLTLSGLHAGC